MATKYPVNLTRKRDGAKRVAHDDKDMIRFGFDGFKPAAGKKAEAAQASGQSSK